MIQKLCTALTTAIFVSLLMTSCGRNSVGYTPQELERRGWTEIEKMARGTTVNFGMWAGEEQRNRYMQGAFAQRIKERFDITLKVVPNGDVAELVNKLLNEKGAGKGSGGSIDMMWINGENFRAAKKGKLLWGPLATLVDSNRFFSEDARTRDFGTTIEGYETPWMQAQFVFAYDSARVPEPPKSLQALGAWIKSHPGRFTYLAPPDFTGSVFIRHVFLDFAENPEDYVSGFDEARYRKAAEPAIAFLNEIRPYLWRKGETYPATFKDADRLFENGEIDFTMSYGPGFASDRIARGEYPKTVRTFVFEKGTIGNYSYLAIPFNASNIPGALVVINYLSSYEEALELGRELGAIFPLNLANLPPDKKKIALELPRGPATLAVDELMAHRLPEPDSKYLERLEEDWRQKVLKR